LRPGPIWGKRQQDSADAFLDDLGVRRVECDDQLEAAARVGDISVAEIHPEEIGVGERISRAIGHDPMFARRSDAARYDGASLQGE
jgi:hypothetical protein